MGNGFMWTIMFIEWKYKTSEKVVTLGKLTLEWWI